MMVILARERRFLEISDNKYKKAIVSIRRKPAVNSAVESPIVL
jgi:hypothetical protein